MVFPVVALPLCCRMLARLLSLPVSRGDSIAMFGSSFAAGCCVLWLLGDGLASVPGAKRFFLAVVLLHLGGGAAYVTTNGGMLDNGLVGWGIAYGAGTAALVTSLTLSARICRSRYSPGRFMIWLLLWSLVLPALAASLVVGIIEPGAIFESMSACGLFGGVIYLASVPFLLLTINCPLYHQRFLDALELTSTRRKLATTANSANRSPALHCSAFWQASTDARPATTPDSGIHEGPSRSTRAARPGTASI